MKNHWHELIQRYLDRQAAVEEVATLQESMKKDADLRALYLDYMNLDVVLAAAAEVATIAGAGSGKTVTPSRLPFRTSFRNWRWLAATAACAALIVFAMLFRDRNRPQQHRDTEAACSSTQAAIARLSVESPAFPAWVSPTASLLDEPRIPRGDL